MLRIVLIIFLLATLSACAPVTRQTIIDPSASETEKETQRELALQEHLKRQLRASTIGYPIFKAAAPYCEDKLGPGIGALITNSTKMPSDWRKTGERLWDLADKPTVVATIPGLPFEQGSLRPGDVITHINGKVVSGSDINDPLKSIARPYKGETITFTVIRNSEPVTLSVQPDTICDYPIEVSSDDSVNAFADGKKIVLTTGMMRFAENDDELATVIGHELAHNQMGHSKKQMGNRLIGAIIGALISAASGVDVTQDGANIGQMAHSQGFESEADYVGIYNTARAGYDINAAPNFWRRMAVEHPKAIGHGTTHPDTANRFLSLENAVQEIDNKRASGTDLVPEMK